MQVGVCSLFSQIISVNLKLKGGRHGGNTIPNHDCLIVMEARYKNPYVPSWAGHRSDSDRTFLAELAEIRREVYARRACELRERARARKIAAAIAADIEGW